MTLQERVLEAIGERSLDARSLYTRFSDCRPSTVDFAIRGLLKAKRIVLVNGVYSRTRPAAQGDVVSAEMTLAPTAVAPGLIIAADATDATTTAISRRLPMRKCRRCQKPKLLTEFGIKAHNTGARLSTCRSCVEAERKRQRPRGKLDIAGNNSAPVVVPYVAGSMPTPTPAPRHTFSPGLTARLVELQRRTALELQVACDEVQRRRQELMDIEELVRIATSRERGT